jgi:hypothetical protein
MNNPLLTPILEIARRDGLPPRVAENIVRALGQWPAWERPILAPPDSWLWHEMTSLHGTDDPAFQVWLNLPDNELQMTLKGTIEKRGRLVVLPWEP